MILPAKKISLFSFYALIIASVLFSASPIILFNFAKTIPNDPLSIFTAFDSSATSSVEQSKELKPLQKQSVFKIRGNHAELTPLFSILQLLHPKTYSLLIQRKTLSKENFSSDI